MTGRRLLVARRWHDGQAMVYASPDRQYWAWPLLLNGRPVIWPKGAPPKIVTFHGDGFLEVVGCSFVEYTLGPLDPDSEREQTAYERGRAARRRLGDDELRRKAWSDGELWAYQEGLKDRASQ